MERRPTKGADVRYTLQTSLISVDRSEKCTMEPRAKRTDASDARGLEPPATAGASPRAGFGLQRLEQRFVLGKSRSPVSFPSTDQFVLSLETRRVPTPEGSDHVRLTSPSRRLQVSRKQTTFPSGVGGPQIQILVPHFPPPTWRSRNLFIFTPSDDVPNHNSVRPWSIPQKPRSWAVRAYRFILHFIDRILAQEIISRRTGSDHVKRHCYKIH